MNKRIQEIVRQSATDTSGKWLSLDNAEKLAESIVRECADIADQAEPFVAYDLILKHFGVEESTTK